jgi:hypothetical protein
VKPTKDEMRVQVAKLERANATLKTRTRDMAEAAKVAEARIAELEAEVARLTRDAPAKAASSQFAPASPKPRAAKSSKAAGSKAVAPKAGRRKRGAEATDAAAADAAETHGHDDGADTEVAHDAGAMHDEPADTEAVDY